jgi:SAM-dependent methyltransferase
MVSRRRWHRAQAYERGYWAGVATRIADGAASQLEWYRWRADRLNDKLRALGLAHVAEGGAAVVEVGSGPIGIVPFLAAAERVAVDPLEPFYATNAVLTTLRSPAVQYRQGVGEQLPCDSGRYDLAIIENCIDHVQDPAAVRGELARVLKPDGVLYLSVNCRTPWGYYVHRVLSRLRLDPGHPYTFTPGRTREFLERGPFDVLAYDVAPYAEARKADLESPERRARLKARLGVSEFLCHVVSRRRINGR